MIPIILEARRYTTLLEYEMTRESREGIEDTLGVQARDLADPKPIFSVTARAVEPN